MSRSTTTPRPGMHQRGQPAVGSYKMAAHAGLRSPPHLCYWARLVSSGFVVQRHMGAAAGRAAVMTYVQVRHWRLASLAMSKVVRVRLFQPDRRSPISNPAAAFTRMVASPNSHSGGRLHTARACTYLGRNANAACRAHRYTHSDSTCGTASDHGIRLSHGWQRVVHLRASDVSKHLTCCCQPPMNGGGATSFVQGVASQRTRYKHG